MTTVLGFSITASATVSCTGQTCGDDCPVCIKEPE